MLKRSAFVVAMGMHLVSWIVWFRSDSLIAFVMAVAGAVAYGGSSHLVSYVRHLGQAFAQHNRPAQLNRHRYAVSHPSASNSTAAVNVVDSHVRTPT